MRKVMLVTGASRGIGAATARHAARAGYDVAVNYRSSTAEAEQVVADCRAAGAKALALQGDVGRDETVIDLFARIDREFGRIDVLINNAGIINRQCRVDEMSHDVVEDIFRANVFSAFFCAREAARRMSTQRGGRGGVILNISSVAAKHGGLPMESHYAATKGALDAFTIGFAKEVGTEGIRVVSVRPGVIVTAIHDIHGGQQTIDRVAPSIPIGRAGTVDEVAEALVWLSGDGASYIHGAIIEVSGGR
jgi:NAD(P)-dependent dehydrogenase (short-subunit alcohol dehydrogenase family)